MTTTANNNSEQQQRTTTANNNSEQQQRTTTANNNSEQQQRTTTARNIPYDWLRIFATLFVLIGHSSYLSIHTGLGGVSYTLPENISPVYYSMPFLLLRKIIEWIAVFHMPLFFILSGAVFALRQAGEFPSVVKSKAKRLLIPYFVYGLGFMFPVKFAGDFYDSGTIGEAVLRFIFGGEAGHLWFLPALFWCFVIFSALRVIFGGSNIKCLIASCVISLLCTYLVHGGYNFLRLIQGITNIIWFSAGYVFEAERKRFTPWSSKIILSVMAVLILLEIIHISTSSGCKTLTYRFAAVILCSSLVYMLSVLCARFFTNAPGSELWNIAVRNSFYIYIFHDPLEYIALKIFMNGGYLASGAGCTAYILSRTAVILIISIFLGETARRAKCHLRFS